MLSVFALFCLYRVSLIVLLYDWLLLPPVWGHLCSLEYDAHALVLSPVSSLVVVVFELACLADGGSVTSEPES